MDAQIEKQVISGLVLRRGAEMAFREVGVLGKGRKHSQGAMHTH